MRPEELKAVPAIDLVREARACLGAALTQSIPSDDQIIMDYIRKAHVLLSMIKES